jgi:Sec-independent protein translocase protein TatA
MGSDVLILLIVILILALMFRGPKTLPKIGQMLGRGVKSAREEVADIAASMHKTDDDPKV